MKFKLLTIISFLILSFVSNAQLCVPTEAEAFFAKAMQEISPAHIRWVKNTASDIHLNKISIDNVTQVATDYGKQYNMATADIEAMIFFVMMQASKTEDNILREQLEELRKANEQKKKMREAITRLKQQQKNQKEILRAEYDSMKRLADPVINVRPDITSMQQPDTLKKVNLTLVLPQKVTPAEIENLKADLRDKLDSMNEMSEMNSIRLQMIMDRRSNMISILSNLMKKIGDTADSIIQNLK